MRYAGTLAPLVEALLNKDPRRRPRPGASRRCSSGSPAAPRTRTGGAGRRSRRPGGAVAGRRVPHGRAPEETRQRPGSGPGSGGAPARAAGGGG
ncbi:hypothetical protein NKH77_17835 [Streptomyces sp. M19]